MVRSLIISFAGLLTLTWVTSQPAMADAGDLIPGSRYTSGRAAALGGAFLALADDAASALFYNPSAIAKLKRTGVEVANIQFQLTPDTIKNFDMDFYKVTGLSGYSSSVASHPNTLPGVGMTFAPTVSMRGASFGLLASTRLQATSDGTNITHRSYYQLVPTFGTALPLASGVVRLGYSLQWVNRASGTNTLAVGDTMGWSRSIAEGSALSHNAALALNLPFTLLPSLNVVARNVGGARYSSFSLVPLTSNKTGLPADEPMSVDLGFGIQPKLGGGSSMNVVLDWRDFTNTSGASLYSHLSGGMELTFRDRFFLRGGVGSGYPALGIGLRTKRADVHMSWYSEERSTSFRDERDVRWLLHYQMRAF
jgi:hypothetical protein